MFHRKPSREALAHVSQEAMEARSLEALACISRKLSLCLKTTITEGWIQLKKDQTWVLTAALFSSTFLSMVRHAATQEASFVTPKFSSPFSTNQLPASTHTSGFLVLFF
jgi:hypothetical protein